MTRLDWALTHLFKAWIENTTSLTSHYLPTVLVLSIENVSQKIENSIFQSNCARKKNVITKHYSSHKGLQIYFRAFL